MSLKTKWFSGLTDQQKGELKASYLAGDLFREKLIILLEKEIDNSLSNMRGAASKQDHPDLSTYYADELSRQRTLAEVIDLLREKI